jgi:hypothetical protein
MAEIYSDLSRALLESERPNDLGPAEAGEPSPAAPEAAAGPADVGEPSPAAPEAAAGPADAGETPPSVPASVADEVTDASPQ